METETLQVEEANAKRPQLPHYGIADEIEKPNDESGEVSTPWGVY